MEICRSVNLALYSDQIIPANCRVDFRLLEMIAQQSRCYDLGYIPSGPDPDLRFFKECKEYYARYGLHLSVFHDLDLCHTGQSMNDLLSCGSIHLSGGNTRAFLERLKRSATLGILRDWALKGGILIGASAGAILMTPSIAADALYSGNRPEEVEDFGALDLLPFEFFPHLFGKPSYLEDLLRYSRSTPRPILACPDGDGVIVTQGKVDCIGKPMWLLNGSIKPAAEFSEIMRF
jgi:dipeptidase E